VKVVPRITNLGNIWRLGVSFTPRPLCTRVDSPLDPLDRRMGGFQIRSGYGGDKKCHDCPCRILDPCRPARRL